MTNTINTQEHKKVLIETWGCQMNVADSETMLSDLKSSNYQLTNNQDDADLILLNTCHIREKAKHKVLSRLGTLKDLKIKNPKLKIAVAGCVAQAEGKKLLSAAPQIDLLLGPGKIVDLRELLEQQSVTGASQISVGFARHDITPAIEIANEPKASLTGRNEISRYVNITQGCDNFCTFCVVPFTRGREISRLPAEILAECWNLLQTGAREISLLGQNVNSYGGDLVARGALTPTPNGTFVDLLEQVSALPGLQRLRFTTSNPHDFSKPLVDLFGRSEVLGKYIHLPVQSGNNEILEAMKRKVTVADYMERIKWLRDVSPDFAISTDMIVGFPGETDAQFEDTMKLVEAVRYTFMFSFMYSPRKNTAAARFRDQVPENIKQDRLRRLNALQEKITVEENSKEIGQIRDVLCLYQSQKRPGSYFGRTEHYRLVRVNSAENLVGRQYRVKITDANKISLTGEIIEFH